jgi:hypothetical protein
MTDPQSLPIPLQPAEPSAGSPLPTTHILTYITGDTTAPRLRKVVTRGILLFAFLHALAFVYLAWNTEENIRNSWGGYVYYAAPRLPFAAGATLRDIIVYAIGDNLRDLLLTLLCGAVALTLFLCAKPAGRGRRIPARLAAAALCPFIFAALLTAALSIGLPLTFAFFNKEFDPSPLPWLLLAPLAALTALLTKDLLAYILWAAKNPLTEKPKTPFLPARP